MRELCGDQPIFVGFKLETGFLRQLEAISGPDKRYVSREDSNFLRICRLGDKSYVGKLIEERLTTDRIDDIKRNIFSILQRLCPDERLPKHLEIVAVGGELTDLGEDPRQQAASNDDPHSVW